MDVNKADAVTPIGEATDGERKRGTGGHAEGKAAPRPGREEAAGGEPQAAPVADPISFLGLDPDGMAPDVRAAFATLGGEISHLRQELDRQRGRVAYLEAQADHHQFLPVLNRRAFARELAKTLAHAGVLGTRASLLGLHVMGTNRVRRRLGRRALDEGLKHVCGAFADCLHATDSIGNLGGADFAVVLLVADGEAAHAKGAVLAEAVRVNGFVWEGEAVPLAVSWGAQVLEPGSDAESVLAAVDGRLLDMAEAEDG